jgi:hypothetical protein
MYSSFEHGNNLPFCERRLGPAGEINPILQRGNDIFFVRFRAVIVLVA